MTTAEKVDFYYVDIDDAQTPQGYCTKDGPHDPDKEWYNHDTAMYGWITNGEFFAALFQ